MKADSVWKKAERIIPGGNSLLSKRPKRFLPNGWPTYYKKAKGINIWDYNNIKYKDFSIMGVGTAVLGYANSEIDNKVISAIKSGINTTLNSHEEYLLALEILKYNKFAQQVKFAKGGGEAMAIAIRIARSNSKKFKVIFSGYHGWHDWYLSANLSNKKNLDNHLLKKINPLGVPKNLKNSIIPFKFNDVGSLKNAFSKNKKEVGIIVIEGARFEYPSKEFIESINELKKKYKLILVVDEITSGWREQIGGISVKLGIDADIIVYGKALGNGYPISAIVGKKKIMSKSTKTFLSSSAWTEKIGFVAALETIKFMKKNRVNDLIKKRGIQILTGWKKIAKNNGLKIQVNYFTSNPTFHFCHGSKNNEMLQTLFTKLMLKKRYLASNSIFVTYAHTSQEIKKYLNACKEVFKTINKHLIDKKFMPKRHIRDMKY
jgi:glutamate-1-semialdehyde 2,1-aminomutase